MGVAALYHFNFAPVFAASDQLLYGAWLTLRLSCGAMLIGLVVSILGAAAKTFGGRLLRGITDVYVELIRNTPFLVQIFFFFFGLPALGLRLSPNSAALLALVVNVGAYGTEIIRSGIDAIKKGQWEAGIALGLKRLQVFRYVVLKPALRTVYPALTSQFVYLMLTSSVVSAISANDLASIGAEIQSQSFASFEVYLVITAMYFVMSLLLSGVFLAIQRAVFRYPLARS